MGVDDMFNLFANIPSVYLIYFFYGGAFLFLSASIAMKDMRLSDLKLAKSLWLLGMFGLTHGAHEWLQLYPLIEGDRLTVLDIYHIKAVALGLFVASYLFLLQFGMALLRATHYRWPRRLSWLPAVLLLLWFAYLRIHGFTMDLQFLRQAAIGARYTFGLAGGLLTSFGLIAYSRELRHLSRSVSKKLHYAGVTFALYAVLGGVFSSNFDLFRLPVPVELLRGLTAVLITFFIIKALNIFDIEMRLKTIEQTRRIVQAEKLTSLGQLAAGIAHEINNPLTNASLGIQTLSHHLKNSGAGGELADKLEAIERNIERAAVIARELLQFSRQRDSDFAPLDVNKVVRGALTLLQYKLKGITVAQDLSELPEILGDAGKLEQVFINLLSNAVEAMPGGGTISIMTMRLDAGIRIRIVDTGPGIPEKNLSRVFDPFFTTKEVGKGTGLGLSICYGIVRDHQGTIDIASAPGKGTAVTLTIPERGRQSWRVEKQGDQGRRSIFQQRANNARKPAPERKYER
jgi:signal transduction histidine kinase